MLTKNMNEMKTLESQDQIIIFQTDDGKVSVDVGFDENTVWLTLDQMPALFE